MLEHEVAMSADMPMVIMVSWLTGLKEAIFCKRLDPFIETFAPVGGWKKCKMLKPTGISRHKAIKGRSAGDVASAFINLVRKNRDIQSFMFCSDNYSFKNRNWFFSTALTNKVNQKSTSIYAITLKCFKPGHTFMSTDSFHHRIKQEMRKKKRL